MEQHRMQMRIALMHLRLAHSRWVDSTAGVEELLALWDTYEDTVYTAQRLAQPESTLRALATFLRAD